MGESGQILFPSRPPAARNFAISGRRKKGNAVTEGKRGGNCYVPLSQTDRRDCVPLAMQTKGTVRVGESGQILFSSKPTGARNFSISGLRKKGNVVTEGKWGKSVFLRKFLKLGHISTNSGRKVIFGFTFVQILMWE